MAILSWVVGVVSVLLNVAFLLPRKWKLALWKALPVAHFLGRTEIEEDELQLTPAQKRRQTLARKKQTEKVKEEGLTMLKQIYDTCLEEGSEINYDTLVLFIRRIFRKSSVQMREYLGVGTDGNLIELLPAPASKPKAKPKPTPQKEELDNDYSAEPHRPPVRPPVVLPSSTPAAGGGSSRSGTPTKKKSPLIDKIGAGLEGLFGGGVPNNPVQPNEGKWMDNPVPNGKPKKIPAIKVNGVLVPAANAGTDKQPKFVEAELNEKNQWVPKS